MTDGSVFSGAALLGQLPFALLVGAAVVRMQDRSRQLIAAAGAVGLVHALAVSGSGLLAFWWGLLLAASLLLMAMRFIESSRVRFTPEEEVMAKGVFSPLPRPRARHLLDQGFWLNGRDGEVLTREGEDVTHLFYLSDGNAKVLSQGKQVGSISPGDLIGEVTILTGDRATATVVLDGPARFWCAPASVLRPYVETHSDVRHALERGVTDALRAKLRASNERAAEAGGGGA